jgi:hypothetical protein
VEREEEFHAEGRVAGAVRESGCPPVFPKAGATAPQILSLGPAFLGICAYADMKEIDDTAIFCFGILVVVG